MKKNHPIGILDSGVGGLTVLKEVQTLLPNEDLIYFGDNKNVPYGSKSKEEIIALTKEAINFLISKNVKLIAVGCNTITTILDLIRADFPLEIIGVIDPVIKHIGKKGFTSLGLIATPFTVNSKYYHHQLAAACPGLELTAQGCPTLAAYIDKGDFTKEGLLAETKPYIDAIKGEGKINTIILGCTHYPIITQFLNETYPEVNFINPAYYQALDIKHYLAENHLLSADKTGKVAIYTSGDTDKYQPFLKTLAIENVTSLNGVI